MPQPVIPLSSRLPPSSSPPSSISKSATSKLKGKGLASPGGGGGIVIGPPASPILKAMSGKGEVRRGAGMRLRTIMGGGSILGTNGDGSGGGSGGGNGSGSTGLGIGVKRGSIS